MWDLTTALDLYQKGEPKTVINGGPTTEELLKQLDQCELGHSRLSTPCCISPSPSMTNEMSAKAKANLSNRD